MPKKSKTTLLDEINITRHPLYEYDKIILDYLKKHDVGFSHEELGLTKDDFKNSNNYIDIFDDELKTFAEPEDDIITVYKYISDAYGSSGIGPNSRPFCRRLIGLDRVYSREDIFEMNTWSGKANRAGNLPYNVFKWRGGNNCKHKWVKYKYNKITKELLKPTFIQPDQPSTRP